MFVECLMESRGQVITRTQQWSTLGSVAFQCALAGLLVCYPLMRPQALIKVANTPRVEVSMPVKPVVVAVAPSQASSTTSSAISVPMARAIETVVSTGARVFTFTHSNGTGDGPAPNIDTGFQMTSGSGPVGIPNLGVFGGGSGTIVVQKRGDAPVRISSGVSKGLLLEPILPVYPAIAKAARVQGAVIIEAVISKAGRIESLRTVSGDPMLRTAAMTAVQAARYQPYKLNGEAVEVQTTITVVFQLG